MCDCLRELQAEPKLLEMLKSGCKALCEMHPELMDAKINDKFTILDHQTKIYFDLLADTHIQD